MISRIRVIALVGAGAIASAGFCSLYLAYSLEKVNLASVPAPDFPDEGIELTQASEVESSEIASPPSEEVVVAKPRVEQAFMVAFLADANPQVRTLAAWGMVGEVDGEEGQREILEFVRHERDPEVRIALYRFLQGQHSLKCSTLVELVRQEEGQTWLASSDLLAGVVQNGASPATETYFNETVVPQLAGHALNGAELPSRIAAIIALRRASTLDSIQALQWISETSNDPQVVLAASSAVRFSTASDRINVVRQTAEILD